MAQPLYNSKTIKQAWSREDLIKVRDMCGKFRVEKIAEILGRTTNSVERICNRQGFSLKLNADYNN